MLPQDLIFLQVVWVDGRIQTKMVSRIIKIEEDFAKQLNESTKQEAKFNRKYKF